MQEHELGGPMVLQSSDSSSPAAISRLPAEILIHVFTHCAFLREHRRHDHNDKDWFYFSQVCQRWRFVALGSPTLWSSPKFKYPSWAREMLARSRDAPLEVKWRFRYTKPLTDNDIVYDALLKYMNRMDRLDLTAPFDVLSDVFLKMTQSAPLLQSLRVETDVIQLSFPPLFLGNHSPRLAELVIQGPHISWDSSIFKNNLTTLKLIHPVDSPLPPPSDRFLAVLHSMSNLEVLELVKALPRLSAAPPGGSSLFFPHLRHLRIVHAPAPDISSLLDQISLPHPSRMRHFELASIMILVSSPQNADLASHVVQKVFSAADPTMLTALQINVWQISAWACSCSQPGCIESGGCPSPHPLFRVSFHTGFNDESFSGQVLRRVWPDMLPIAGIHALCLVPGYNVEGDWEIMGSLAPLGNLATVTIGRSVAEQFLRALSRNSAPTDSADDELHRVSFRALRAVDIHDVVFETESYELFDTLKAALKVRSENDGGIRKLILRRCVLSNSMLRELRSLVEELIYVPPISDL
ncbi:hypothetical protein PQX77_012299 [Marasmius sp. AFHP31]|nr:hypothetical protein PQX77_012299 [Marasmius sp. AFHP31]